MAVKSKQTLHLDIDGVIQIGPYTRSRRTRGADFKSLLINKIDSGISRSKEDGVDLHIVPSSEDRSMNTNTKKWLSSYTHRIYSTSVSARESVSSGGNSSSADWKLAYDNSLTEVTRVGQELRFTRKSGTPGVSLLLPTWDNYNHWKLGTGTSNKEIKSGSTMSFETSGIPVTHSYNTTLRRHTVSLENPHTYQAAISLTSQGNSHVGEIKVSSHGHVTEASTKEVTLSDASTTLMVSDKRKLTASSPLRVSGETIGSTELTLRFNDTVVLKDRGLEHPDTHNVSFLDKGTYYELTATDFILSSDRKWKYDVKELKITSEDTVNWVKYNFQDSESFSLGAIAQDLPEYLEDTKSKTEYGYVIDYISLLSAKIGILELKLKNKEAELMNKLSYLRDFKNMKDGKKD